MSTGTSTQYDIDPSIPAPEGVEPILVGRGLVKRFGRVTALAGADFELYPGAMIPNEGTVVLDGEEQHFRSPQDAQAAGIETVYQTLAVAPALDIASNMFLGRERRREGFLGRVLRMVDTPGMRKDAKQALDDLGIGTLQDITQAVETLSGGQRQAVAVARAAAS